MSKTKHAGKGRPDGNGPEEGTGIPTKISDATRGGDERLTDAYTDDDTKIAGSVPQRHHNRHEVRSRGRSSGGYNGL